MLVVFVSPLAQAEIANHNIAAANITVAQNDTSNNTSSVTVTTSLAINDFGLRDGSNRGDYNVQVGAGFNDDSANGVLMACIAENGRDNGDTNYPGANFCTAAIDRSSGVAGAYFISTFHSPLGDEFNINVAAAYFPYTDWLGGFARNSGGTNNGANNSLTASPGLSLGTNFIDMGGGTSVVSLLSFGIDARTDGVLLVTGARNEDNYALSQVNSNNGTWTVYVKDNGTDAGSYEQDPVAFVFIPKTNTSVISGKFRGDGTRIMFSGSTPQFTVTNVSGGTWRLTIPGQSPSSGVLIISAEGGVNQNQDNIVSFEGDGSSWLIQSRDLPGDPPGLQTPSGGSEPVASFVFIPAPFATTLIAPPDNGQGLPQSPSLQVAISNLASGTVSVKFYGRIAPANPREDFAIVALPDTQFYTSSLNGGVPEMFYSQAEWIITNRVSRNIAYVAHLGDISQNGDIKSGNANTTEWRNATNAMYRLENPARTFLSSGIPYGMAVGNHDQEPIGEATGTTTFYNQYFGINHFDGRPYYAGHYGTNNDNHFDFFSAGGMEFIVLYFEYDSDADPDVLAWANEVLRTNANRRAIIVTHNFGNTQTPLTFSAQGGAIYDALKTNMNIFMMLAGHVTGQGTRSDTYNGHVIRTFVSDYQGWTNGGNGYMRIIDFSPSNNTVTFTTYSPWVDDFATEPNSELWFYYDMSVPAGSNAGPFSLIGTVTNVASGGIASMVWSNLQVNTAYQWQVVVTDSASNSITGPIWRFVTLPNSPPTIANMSRTISADAATNLTLQASDPNGDDLTFQLVTLPTHGAVTSFVPETGVVTYAPIHGYRGTDRFTFSASDGEFSTTVASMNITIVNPADGNANGLPDSWEAKYGVTNPNGDNDGDGQSNFAEYSANTNPTNAASLLKIIGASRKTNGHFDLAWSSIGGSRYRVQYGESNALSTGAFVDIVRNLTNEIDASVYGTVSTQRFTDDFTVTGGAPTNRSRYFRVKVVQ